MVSDYKFFNLDMGVVIKAKDDWHDVGQPYVAIYCNCHLF